MSVRYYAAGEHPNGLIGFRVAVAVGGDHRGEFFSTRECASQDDSCFAFKRQRMLAEIQDAEWMAESALAQYKRYVTTNHPRAKKYRGVGVHSLTATFYVSKSKVGWRPAFSVNANGKPCRFPIGTDLFSDAWRKAVLFWGEAHEILQEDIDRLLNNPPDPSQFKLLRRQMNEEGFDIPVEVLNDVFAERRMELASKKLLGNSATEAVNDQPAVEENDIAAWFNSELKKA